MRLKFQTSSLRETKPMEYAQRFAFGGFVTVIATLIANKWGPVIGGLFLAFPGIYPASVSLVEKHKIQREAVEGKQGTSSARGEASVESTGASAGALGLAAFATVLWWLAPRLPMIAMLACAALAWTAVSWICWLIREKL